MKALILSLRNCTVEGNPYIDSEINEGIGNTVNIYLRKK